MQAARSLWRVRPRLRAERASDQSSSRWIEWTCRQLAASCAEADAVDRAQRYLRGEGAGPLWRRLSDAIGRRARIVRLYWVVRAHWESVDDAWAGPYSGSEEGCSG